MPAPDLQLFDSTDTTEVASITFTDIIPGTPSAAQEFHLWNSWDATPVDPAQNLIQRILARIPGDTTFVGTGLEILDTGGIEVRVISGGDVGSTTSWKPLGSGRDMSLPNLAFGETVHMEVRVNVLPGHETDAVEISFRVDSQRSSPRSAYAYIETGAGVISGVGEADVSYLLTGGLVTENTVPDDEVIVEDVSWISLGVPHTELVHNETLDGDDGDSATLIAGEAYYALVEGTVSGINVVKGSKNTTPLTDADKPEGSDGGVPLAFVVREFDAIIDNVDIEDVRSFGLFHLTDSGLSADVSPGVALVGGFLVRKSVVDTLTLIASSTNSIWIKETGGLAVTTDGLPADPLDLLIYELTTDGSGVTATVDRRPIFELISRSVGGGELNTRRTLAVGDQEIRLLSSNSFTVMAPGLPLEFWLDEPGTSTGGSYIWDLEYSTDLGTSWITIFTSQGGDDRRPTIPAASNWDNSAMPEVLVYPPGALFRVRLIAVPSTNNAAGFALKIHLLEIR